MLQIVTKNIVPSTENCAIIKDYYVYIFLDVNDYPVYIGKGKDNREHGAKNTAFEKVRYVYKYKSVRPYINLTEPEALTLEAQLISKYRPMYNIQEGWAPAKWVDTDKLRFWDTLDVSKAQAIGARSATPITVCKEFVKDVGAAQSIMFVGDRYSGILKEFLSTYPDYAGKIMVLLEQGDGNMATFEKVIGDKPVEFVAAKNFLTAGNLPKVDYVLMNPPFNLDKSTRKLWKQFVDKARTLAGKSVYTLMPKRGNLDLEHTVLIPTVEFASTPALGQAVVIKAGAKHKQVASQQLSLKLQINVSHVYADGIRTGYIPPQFIGISRNKQESLCYIRSSADNKEASLWLISGPDLILLEQLFAKYNFEATVTNYKIKKGQTFGHAPSINKDELIPLINQLYEHHQRQSN